MTAGSAAAAQLMVTVTDQDGAPIENATAYLYSQSGSYKGRYAATDANGSADLGDAATLADGTYAIKAVYLGQTFWGLDFDLPAGTDQSLTIETAPITVEASYAGQPAAQVRIYLFSSTGAYLGINQLSDTDGRIALILPVGRDFKVRADILRSQYFSPVFQPQTGGSTVAVDAGGGQLSVRLQKDAATPMAGIKLYLFNTTGAYVGRQMTSDDDGNALFAVPEGDYRIRADYLGYQFWSQDVHITADSHFDFTIAHADITFRLNGQYDNPAPIQGVKLYLFTPAGSYIGINKTTDAAGEVQLSLPDQDYKVRADYLGQKFWSQSFAFADAELNIPLAQVDLSVVWNGMPLDNVNVYLFSATGSYTGIKRTTDANGRISYQLPQAQWQFRADYQSNQYWASVDNPMPGQVTPHTLSTGGGVLNFGVTLYQNDSQALPGIKCYVFNDQGSYTGVNGTTDDQGQVAFELAAGTYQTRVDYLGYQFMSEIYDLTADTTDIFDIPHQQVTLTVNGLFDTPVPLADLKVYLFSGTGAYLGQQLTTDANGQVVLNLPEKDYKARIDYMGHQYWSAVIDSTDPVLNIPMARPAVSVTGADQYLAGTKVYAFNENGNYLGFDGVTDDQGQVIFELPVGQYKFRITYQGHTFWSDVVDLAAGGTPYVPISAGGGSFTLTALKDVTTPLANTKCFLFNSAGTQYLGQWAYTDEYGQVGFDLVDGSFSFRLDHLGYQFFSPTYQVPETLTASLTIAHHDLDVTVSGLFDSPQPLENVKVYLFSSADSYLGQYQSTPADGIVSFQLPARDFKVRADYMGNQFWSPVFNDQSVSVDIPLGRANVTVSGVAQSLENIPVYAFTGNGSYLGLKVDSDSNGISRFMLPAAVDYKFRADYQGSKFWSDPGQLNTGQDNAVAIDTGGGHFELTVEQDAYTPLADLKCYVYTGAGAYIGTFGTSDAQGRLNFALADGAYKFKINYAGYSFWTPVRDVPAILQDTLTIAHSRKVINVQGINPGPAPIAGAKAYVYTEAGAYIGMTMDTDASGRAMFDLPDQSYKVKIVHDGQSYWTGTLTGPDTVVSINLDDGALPGAPISLTASIVDASRVDLAWTPPADTAGIAGYAIYRRMACEENFVRLNTTLTAADATTFSDTSVSGSDALLYYVVGVNGQDLEGQPSPTALADPGGGGAGTNTQTVANLVATWNQEQAQLTWDNQAGLLYQIYRGSDPAALSPYARVDASPFVDADSASDQTYYFQVATVQRQCDPASGQTVDLIGPLSALITLGAQGGAAATVGLPIDTQGNYVINTGANTGHSLQGSYDGIDGDVVVTAILGDITVTGTGSDGQFSIDLPHAGNWQITIGHVDGWPSATIDTVWQIDDQPPSLSVDGPDQRSTTASQITITGLASDADSALQNVSLSSDRYPGLSFGAALGNLGSYSAQVPLKPGDNQLTVSAADIHGNTATKAIIVTQEVTALPVITITSPADGAVLTTQPVSVSGSVRSSLAPEQIRLQLGDQVIFPEGMAVPYSFVFNNVVLVPGDNQIVVSAQTPHGTASAGVGVTLGDGTSQEETGKPEIEVYAPLPETFLAGPPTVTGLVRSQVPILNVTVNGEEATCAGLGTPLVSFQAIPAIADGAQTLTITISATDTNNQSESLSYNVGIDSQAPVITLDASGLQDPPDVNPVNQSPYVISGVVTEANMAGLSINDQAVGLNLSGDNTYTFNASLPLNYGQDQHLTLVARDMAGNSTSREWIVNLASDLAIEVISPRNGALLQAQGAAADITVTMRVAGAAATDVFTVALNDGPPQALSRTGTVGNATLSVPADQSDHRLTFSVQNDAGGILAGTTTAFTLENMDGVPLAVEELKPANGARGVEPNDFIAIHFNKVIDPALLQIEVLETAHGKTYAPTPKGADITELSTVQLVDVHHDRVPVPGGISHFPGNRMVAFYPESDLSYGATIYVTVTYDNSELERAAYQVRTLPTFIEGAVVDTMGNALKNITVAIPDLGLSAVSNKDGGFGFGFKVKADQNIPGGRYRAVFNPGMKVSRYGITEQWINVEEGRRNAMPVVKLPSINSAIPFRRIISGQDQNLLADGALVLDLSEASLTFADMRDQGDVHVQLLSASEFAYPQRFSTSAYWLFTTQPAGITVAGNVGMQVAIPMLNGNYTYVRGRGVYFVLVGLDPQSLTIVPVGVGELNLETKVIHSIGALELERLDYLGFALVPAAAQPYLEQFANEEIDLRQLIAALEELEITQE